MKKTLILLIFILLSFSVYAGLKGVGTPYLNANLVSQEPSPVQPGEITTLKFKIENNGTQTKENVKAELVVDYPFKVYSEKIIDIGKLQASQSGADAVIVEFDVKVDEQAVESSEKVDLKIYVDGVWINFKDFTIKIRTRETALAIESIETEPAMVSPGADFKLKMLVSNGADSLIRNVKIVLDLNSTTVPFAPSESTTDRYIYSIPSKAGKVMVFDLTALPNAEGGTYKVPIKISYTDESGNSISESNLISLKISSASDLLISLDDYKKGENNDELTLKIVNRGLTNIKLLSASISPDKRINILSNPEVYVGNIDSDDYETTTFKIKLNTYDKLVDIPVKVTYRDVVNKPQQENVNLQLNTGNKGLLLTILTGLLKTAVTIVVVAGIAYFGYRLYKKRKR